MSWKENPCWKNEKDTQLIKNTIIYKITLRYNYRNIIYTLYSFFNDVVLVLEVPLPLAWDVPYVLALVLGLILKVLVCAYIILDKYMMWFNIITIRKNITIKYSWLKNGPSISNKSQMKEVDNDRSWISYDVKRQK